MLCESRATRVSVRRVHDIVFPEVVSFPLRQRLNFLGAFEDVTLPSPHVYDESELFSVIAGEGGIDDVIEYDGLVRDNRPSFRRTKVTELACAIEPDATPDTTEPIHSSCDQPGAIAEAPDSAVPPLLDADHAQGRGEEAKEIPTSSRAPPSGRRRDDFGSPIRRSVWTPPWSPRPPHLEPEPWLSLTKTHQADERQRWRAGDPDGFELQRNDVETSSD